MPTNPLWKEHTEKAAWETVKALREQVEVERARAERLARIEPALPRMADLLDQASEQLDIKAKRPVVVVERLVERVRALTDERDGLRAELKKAKLAAPGDHESIPAAGDKSQSSEAKAGMPPSLRWFARQLEQRRRERATDDESGPAARGLPQVATATEQRLQSLTPLPYAPRALLELAIDLGLTAFELARAARRAE